MHARKYSYGDTCTQVLSRTHIHTHTHTHARAHTHVRTFTQPHMHALTHTHAYARTYSHTHTQCCKKKRKIILFYFLVASTHETQSYKVSCEKRFATDLNLKLRWWNEHVKVDLLIPHFVTRWAAYQVEICLADTEIDQVIGALWRMACSENWSPSDRSGLAVTAVRPGAATASGWFVSSDLGQGRGFRMRLGKGMN